MKSGPDARLILRVVRSIVDSVPHTGHFWSTLFAFSLPANSCQPQRTASKLSSLPLHREQG
jgi:hypothetical protein